MWFDLARASSTGIIFENIRILTQTCIKRTKNKYLLEDDRLEDDFELEEGM